ncbi:serine/threonine-protein kinase [Streptomyces sp. SHP 1-2]|uniref:serine/threonine-protein kinase n=1 Tax=Streptomyces sp. SHP 1-2 TaxID=2769489 RepID=UPI0022387FB8|nr:serine/threonine-protein kinase [Streptomyces sp. SHP 1-2]MCW5251549.1 serine/threonine protein kinase [Streptomyces sp. SHP 1-2]
MSEPERAGTPRTDKDARLLAGRYRLGDVLGRGGMGTVWRAADETLGRTVAVKELRFPGSIDEDEKRRLITRTLREAKAIARIRNTSAVTVFDVVEEDDRPWIVMELVEGKSLAEVIRDDGLLEPRRAAEVGLAILDVLRSAHREGILHRDVKPSNVLIADDGRVVLTDFGIAQVEGDPSITSTGMLVGAPSYISPERARGHKPGPAADLWSLGGLLYAAVEGVPPYDKGSAIATLTAVMTESLEEPRNAGPLRDVIHGLLTKDPAQRLDDAGARALLTRVIRDADRADAAETAGTTRVVPLPAQQGRQRPSRSARRTAVGAGAAAPAAGRAAPAVPGAPPPPMPGGPPGAPAPGGGAANGATGGRSAGWPVMAPPDLPPRPAPRAPLTDVVPRRTLVIIAVVVALAVLGTVLALTLGGGDDDKDARAAAARTASGASTTAGRGGPGDTRTDGSASGPAEEGAEDGAAADRGGDGAAPDEGGAGAAATHRGTQGYSIGLPEGWSFGTTGTAGDRFTGPKGQKLLIAWTSTPKDDPVADWQNQERYMVRARYERIRIEKVEYRGWNAADWEFTYTEDGTGYRTVDRGFVVNDHQGYALMYTARAADWDGDLRRDTWRTLSGSFRSAS